MANLNLLNSGMVGKTQYHLIKESREKTLSKWDNLGFLKGLKANVKENVAQLYENTAGAIINESTNADGSSGSFETVVFPIVRRVFSKLLANDIVSVQAMNMPIGKLFYFVPVTSSRVNANGETGDPHVDGQYSAHTSMADQLPDCVVGANCNVTKFECKNLYDLYYNDGLFDNSKGEITINVLTGSPVNISADGCEFTSIASGVTATDGSVRHVMLALTGFDSTNKGRLTGPDGNEMDSESFLSSLKLTTASAINDPDGNTIVPAGGEVPWRVVTQKYGKGIVEYGDICDNEGTLYIEMDLTHPVATTGTETYDGYVGADAPFVVNTGTFNASYASYGSLELETEMGEVSFRLDEVVVSVTERKLRATWSPELAQDVSAFHNLNAEAELTSILSEQIAGEIDREILRDLRKGAAWHLRWDYNGWRKTSSASNAYTQKEWNQTLITKLNQIGAQIFKTTLRGGANFAVVSAEISAVFDDLEYFHASNASPEQDQYNMGIDRVGSMQGRYQIYRDPHAPAKSMIIGHKGKSLLDTGYIYAPYVPLQLTPTLINHNSFGNVKGIMTRYAKKLVNNRFYGVVTVDGIPTFNVAELR